MKKIDTACIIDDDPIFIYGTRKIMELTSFCEHFMIYQNGKEAFDGLKSIMELQQQMPDVIFLDLNMPIWDGWQFLDEFTKIPPVQPILIYIVTSSINPQDIERAKTYSRVNNYFIKPITTSNLQSVLQTISNAA